MVMVRSHGFADISEHLLFADNGTGVFMTLRHMWIYIVFFYLQVEGVCHFNNKLIVIRSCV